MPVPLEGKRVQKFAKLVVTNCRIGCRRNRHFDKKLKKNVSKRSSQIIARFVEMVRLRKYHNINLPK